MWKTLTSLILSTLAWSHAAERTAPTRPTHVAINADDLGYGDLGCTGSRQIPTPHIDRLARQGVFCSRAYVTAPMCAPSRMGLLTGKFPKRYGITTNPNTQIDYLPETHYGLPQTETCLPAYLKRNGYTSAAIGKWHLGHTEGYTPVDRGFDTWWGFLGGSRHYFEHKPEAQGLNPSRIETNTGADTKISYLTDDIARESVRFIRRQKQSGKPFFLYAAFNAPHWPLQAKPQDLEQIKNVRPGGRRTYCAMVHALDRAVGDILAAIDETGKTNDTIVIFLSDNGGAPHSPACNAPFKGEKRLHYEGGIRVPFIVRYPADKRLAPGSTCGQIVSTVDILPMMLAANGMNPPQELDGTDLLRLLPMQDNREKRTLYWCTDYTSAILDGDSKYILVPDRAPQLYDLSRDHIETNDLYPTHIGKASPLAGKLGSYLTTTPACRYPDAVSWSSGLLKQYSAAKPATQPQPEVTNE